MDINVVLADDQPVVIAGIECALTAANHVQDTADTIKVAGSAHNFSELVELLDRCPCDVLVADYSIPGGKFGDELSLFSFLRSCYPQLCIVIFAVSKPVIVRELAKIGVQSFISKGAKLSRLVSAIHAVHAGQVYFPGIDGSSDATQAAEAPYHRHESKKLSKREAEVIRLFISGMSIQEIAERLKRQKQTVSTQKRTAMMKLGITRDVDLFWFAHETGSVGELSQPVSGSHQSDNEARTGQ